MYVEYADGVIEIEGVEVAHYIAAIGPRQAHVHHHPYEEILVLVFDLSIPDQWLPDIAWHAANTTRILIFTFRISG